MLACLPACRGCGLEHTTRTHTPHTRTPLLLRKRRPLRFRCSPGPAETQTATQTTQTRIHISSSSSSNRAAASSTRRRSFRQSSSRFAARERSSASQSQVRPVSAGPTKICVSHTHSVVSAYRSRDSRASTAISVRACLRAVLSVRISEKCYSSDSQARRTLCHRSEAEPLLPLPTRPRLTRASVLLLRQSPRIRAASANQTKNGLQSGAAQFAIKVITVITVRTCA